LLSVSSSLDGAGHGVDIVESEIARAEPHDLDLLYIKSDDGRRTVPLSAVARWSPTLGPQSVNHVNQFTSVTFSFNLMPGMSLGDATQFIEQTSAQLVQPRPVSGGPGQTSTRPIRLGRDAPENRSASLAGNHNVMAKRRNRKPAQV
jgi:multidrug efflux pump subunit AcrB